VAAENVVSEIGDCLRTRSSNQVVIHKHLGKMLRREMSVIFAHNWARLFVSELPTRPLGFWL